jgi:site-specific DNA-methyltransferase (adenine-specific)
VLLVSAANNLLEMLPIPSHGRSAGSGDHPAATPDEAAAGWCRYILPPGGVLLDPFCGPGTMLLPGLNHGASKVIGVDRVTRDMPDRR